MELPALELMTLFFKLLPGFLAAAVFHSLTPYPRRDVLDRIVTALIFTLFAEIGVSAVHGLLVTVGEHVYQVGTWTDGVQLGWAAVFGLALGVGTAHAVNNGHPHRWLQSIGSTKKTSLPTQWFSAFSRYDRFLILHLMDGRRLKGWPREWPDEPKGGHFILERPSWVLKDGKEIPMHQLEVYLIASDEVKAIEFLRFRDDPELEKRAEEISGATNALIATRNGGL